MSKPLPFEISFLFTSAATGFFLMSLICSPLLNPDVDMTTGLGWTLKLLSIVSLILGLCSQGYVTVKKARFSRYREQRRDGWTALVLMLFVAAAFAPLMYGSQ